MCGKSLQKIKILWTEKVCNLTSYVSKNTATNNCIKIVKILKNFHRRFIGVSSTMIPSFIGVLSFYRKTEKKYKFTTFEKNIIISVHTSLCQHVF